MRDTKSQLNVNQESKRVSLFLGSYEARISTRKINDKTQNEKRLTLKAKRRR